MITRTRYATTERNATVRQSEVNLGEPWEPSLEVEGMNGQVENYYLVRASEEQVVYQSLLGDTITVLKEEE